MKKLISRKKPPGTANRINGSPSSSSRLERESAARALLSSRQIEIAGLVALGLSDKEVANQLHLTEGTVGWHLNDIFKKWRIHNRTLLVAQFLQEQGSEPQRQAPLTNVRVDKREDYQKIQRIEESG